MNKNNIDKIQNVRWVVEYWCNEKGDSAVEEWLDKLTDEQMKSVAKELTLLGLCGNLLKLPHSKSLKQGLFELRERKFGYRIYYTFLPDYQILMLQAGDKKSQDRDIKIARQRLDEITRDKGR